MTAFLGNAASAKIAHAKMDTAVGMSEMIEVFLPMVPPTVTAQEHEIAVAISYTNIQGDVLELTFFSPEMSYNGQYKVNGKAVDLNTEYISKSDYMQQKAGSNSVQFHTATGTENLQLE